MEPGTPTSRRTGDAAPTPVCPRCRYDLTGAVESWRTACPIDGTCPECGYAFAWASILLPGRVSLTWNCFSPIRPFWRTVIPTAARSARPIWFWRLMSPWQPMARERAALYLIVPIVALHLVLAFMMGVEQQAWEAAHTAHAAREWRAMALAEARAETAPGAPPRAGESGVWFAFDGAWHWRPLLRTGHRSWDHTWAWKTALIPDSPSTELTFDYPGAPGRWVLLRRVSTDAGSSTPAPFFKPEAKRGIAVSADAWYDPATDTLHDLIHHPRKEWDWRRVLYALEHPYRIDARRGTRSNPFFLVGAIPPAACALVSCALLPGLRRAMTPRDGPARPSDLLRIASVLAGGPIWFALAFATLAGLILVAIDLAAVTIASPSLRLDTVEVIDNARKAGSALLLFGGPIWQFVAWTTITRWQVPSGDLMARDRAMALALRTAGLGVALSYTLLLWLGATALGSIPLAIAWWFR